MSLFDPLAFSAPRTLAPTPYICAIPGSDITDNRFVHCTASQLRRAVDLKFHHHPFSTIGKRASLAHTPETNRFFSKIPLTLDLVASSYVACLAPGMVHYDGFPLVMQACLFERNSRTEHPIVPGSSCLWLSPGPQIREASRSQRHHSDPLQIRDFR